MNENEIEVLQQEEKEEALGTKRKSSNGFWTGIAVGVLVTVILIGSFVGVVAYKLINTSSPIINLSTSQKVKILQNYIEHRFLYSDRVSEQDLEDGIYRGIVAALDDKYTVYYSAEEYKKYMESFEGSFYGIGVYFYQDSKTNEIIVSSPMSGSPAEKAGVSSNDILKWVDGEDISGQLLSDVIRKVKGEEGTPVDLGFIRDGERIDFTIVRAKIDAETVAHRMLENNIGYISIAEFDAITYDQFKEAYDDLEGQGMKSLVLDLRNNTGGDVSSCCKIADILLPEGIIVSREDKDKNKRENFSDAKAFGKPLVVLVNGITASASEIITGAIKDYGVGTIVGTKTYGKGVVQELYNLGDGSGLVMTVADYYTPSGNNIHQIGIEPDITLELDVEAYLKNGDDNQLQKAIEILNQ